MKTINGNAWTTEHFPDHQAKPSPNSSVHCENALTTRIKSCQKAIERITQNPTPTLDEQGIIGYHQAAQVVAHSMLSVHQSAENRAHTAQEIALAIKNQEYIGALRTIIYSPASTFSFALLRDTFDHWAQTNPIEATETGLQYLEGIIAASPEWQEHLAPKDLEISPINITKLRALYGDFLLTHIIQKTQPNITLFPQCDPENMSEEYELQIRRHHNAHINAFCLDENFEELELTPSVQEAVRAAAQEHSPHLITTKEMSILIAKAIGYQYCSEFENEEDDDMSDNDFARFLEEFCWIKAENHPVLEEHNLVMCRDMYKAFFEFLKAKSEQLLDFLINIETPQLTANLLNLFNTFNHTQPKFPPNLKTKRLTINNIQMLRLFGDVAQEEVVSQITQLPDIETSEILIAPEEISPPYHEQQPYTEHLDSLDFTYSGEGSAIHFLQTILEKFPHTKRLILPKWRPSIPEHVVEITQLSKNIEEITVNLPSSDPLSSSFNTTLLRLLQILTGSRWTLSASEEFESGVTIKRM